MAEVNGGWQDASEAAAVMAEPLSEELVTRSQPFVGRWNRLVSTTNWEKGRIISQWREALVAAGAAATEYADEAWALLVGGVSGQHVGRLRRVYQRFGTTFEKFAGLYWSHFQAAIDWPDAEMWLEGAVQSEWSVARMRQQRWETLGRVESERPQPADIVAEEPHADDSSTDGNAAPIHGTYEEISGPLHEGPDFGDGESSGVSRSGSAASELDEAHDYSRPPIELVQPFAALPALPDDLAEGFDAFKLALLRHKTDGWRQISRDDALRAIEALKMLALAPASEEAPF